MHIYIYIIYIYIYILWAQGIFTLLTTHGVSITLQYSHVAGQAGEYTLWSVAGTFSSASVPTVAVVQVNLHSILYTLLAG